MSDPFEVEKGLKRAERLTLTGGKFGRRVRAGKPQNRGAEVPVAGYATGAIAGGLTARRLADPKRKIEQQQVVSNSKEQASNTRQINSAMRRQTFGKSYKKVADDVHLITDVGTRAAKKGYHGDSMPPRPRRRLASNATRVAFGIGAGVGSAAGYSGGKQQIAERHKKLAQQNKKLTVQRSNMATLGISKGVSMSTSAFGVDHGDFSKAVTQQKQQPPMSPGRTASAALFSPIHGAVAGKPGKKLRASGNELGGSVIGAGLGLAANRGRPGPLSQAGGIGGAILGAQRNQSKGYYKPQ